MKIIFVSLIVCIFGVYQLLIFAENCDKTIDYCLGDQSLLGKGEQ
jgi:hypothetical protein